MEFYLLQNEHYLNKKTQCADRVVVSDVTDMPVCCYMYGHMFFMTQCYPLNNNNSYDKAFYVMGQVVSGRVSCMCLCG